MKTNSEIAALCGTVKLLTHSYCAAGFIRHTVDGMSHFADDTGGVTGIYIINLKKTWEKLLLAARAIAAIENPADVCVISARPYGQRAVLKFASYTGATPIAGRFTPGTFTNQIQVDSV